MGAAEYKEFFSYINLDEHKQHIKMNVHMTSNAKWAHHVSFNNPTHNI
jgi:hypothetical protein